MRCKFISWILVLLFLISFASAITVSVYPSEKDVQDGSSVYSYVRIDTNVDVYAVQFTLNFDNNVNVLSVEEDSFLGRDGAGTYPVITYNNNQGSVEFADTRISVGNGVSGVGNLARIKFQGVNVGEGNLILSDVIVLDTNLNKLWFTINNGKIEVKGTSTPDYSTSDDDSGSRSRDSGGSDYYESDVSVIDAGGAEETQEDEYVKGKTFTAPKGSLDWKIYLFVGLFVLVILLVIYSLFKKLL